MRDARLIYSSDLSNSWKDSNYQGHSLHFLCSRICSFPPSLCRHFILEYSKKGDVVFDPFSGKGGIPLEALINERIGIGNDISPEAFVLTKAKVRPISYKKTKEFIDKLRNQINFETDYTKNVNSKIKIFYHKKTLNQIIQLKNILKDSLSKEVVFVKAILLGILHGSNKQSLSLPCSHSYSMSPNYVKRYAKEHNLKKPKKDVLDCVLERAKIVLKDDLPKLKGKAYSLDSRNLKKMNENSVDLIVTSPPYFNIQTYAYDNWLRLWFLDYTIKEVNNMIVQTGSKKRYTEFMKESLSEMNRVLKKGKNAFIVVGDVRLGKRKELIKTAEFIRPLAEEVGFKTEAIILDNIPNKKKVLTYLDDNRGVKIERTLWLKKI